jgi:tetratricopeptide (TPR) repeat protein
VVAYHCPVEYPDVADFDKWSIITGMKWGLDMVRVRPAICALLVTVMLTLGCASPAPKPGLTDNSSGGHKLWEKAVAEITQALNMTPASAFAYNLRGLGYYYKGEYDKAIADYTSAIELDSKFASAYYNRGLAYNSKVEYDRAIADFTKAIEIDPKYTQAYNQRAFIYYKEGQYDKFNDDVRKSQELMQQNKVP